MFIVLVEKIDMESFLILDRLCIINLLKMYPIGIRLKFIKAFEKWKLEHNNNSQDLRMEYSTNSIASCSSGISKVIHIFC